MKQEPETSQKATENKAGSFSDFLLKLRTKIKEDRQNSLSRVLLLIAFIAFLGIALIETVVDRYCLFEDQSYMSYVLDARQNLHNGRYDKLMLYYHNYPPAFFVLSAFVLPDMEFDRAAAGTLNFFWLSIALLGTFVWLRKKISAWPAFFAITVFVASPAFRYALKYITIDNGILAVFPWMLWAVSRSESFKSTAWSIVAGLLVALGALMRHDFLFLAMLPVCLHALIAISEREVKSLGNGFLFCLVVGGILAAFWALAQTPSASVAFEPAPKEAFWRIWYHPILLSKILFPKPFLYLAAGGLFFGILIRPKIALTLLFFFLAILSFYSLFWLFFGIKNNFGEFLWNYKYMLIPTLMLSVLAGLLWQVPSNFARGVLAFSLLMIGLPLVMQDFSVQDPAPMGRDDAFVVRPISFLDSNLGPYRRLLRNQFPNGATLGVYDASPDPHLSEKVKNDLVITKLMLEDAASFLENDGRYQVRAILPQTDPLPEVDGLLIPKADHLKYDWQESKKSFPFLVSPGLDDNLIWYLVISPENPE